jgi:tRNA (guanine-N7-)-methyltransferase
LFDALVQFMMAPGSGLQLQRWSERTFKPRRRSISATRQLMWAAAIERWGITEVGEPFDPGAFFGRHTELVLEIGSGDGAATIEMARARPDQNVIAIDVHTPGIANILEAIESERLTNLRVVHGDAMNFLGRCPNGIFAEVRVLFPDPWPKRKQQHRRLFAQGRLDEILRVLAPQGSLRVATDVEEYARWFQRLCDAHPELEGGVIPRDPHRPVTRFEQLGLAAGRSTVELSYGWRCR